SAKDVLELSREDLIRRAAPLHHRYPVFLGYRGVCERKVAGERTQQEIDLVLTDELRVLTHAQVNVGLVVIYLQGELALLVADFHAALLINLINGELVGVLIIAARVGERPGQLDRGTERYVRRRRSVRDEQGCGEKASRYRSADPEHCVSP